jgi:hypothetical protein
LSHENAGLGAGVAKPGFPGQAIRSAMMFAEMAIRQQRPRNPRPFAGQDGTWSAGLRPSVKRLEFKL